MAAPIEEQEEQWHLYPTGSQLGSVSINPDVIARIAQHAISQIDGVELDSRKNFIDTLNVFSKEPRDAVKGIRMEKSEDGRYVMVVDLRMAYGVPMLELAEKTQRTIKEAIESMTGHDLESVDVRIVDIFMQSSAEKELRPDTQD